MATEIESRNRPPETATDPAIGQWRGLKRAATLVAVLTSPVAYIWFREAQDWSVAMSLLATVGEIALFRAALDLVLRWFIPGPACWAPTRSSARSTWSTGAAPGSGEARSGGS